MDQQELSIFRNHFITTTTVEGTIGPVTLYKIKDWGHYVRAKSALTGKRVKTDKRFKKTMQEAALLGQASSCVAPVYNRLTEDWRCHEVYRKLTGIAIGLLRAGNIEEKVQQALHVALIEMGYRRERKEDELPPNLQLWLEEELSITELQVATSHPIKLRDCKSRRASASSRLPGNKTIKKPPIKSGFT